MDITHQVDQVEKDLEVAADDLKALTSTRLFGLVRQVVKDYSRTITHSGEVNANIVQLARKNPEQARRLAAGAIVLLHMVADVRPARFDGLDMDSVDEVLDEDKRDAILLAATAAIEREGATLRERGAAATSFPEDEILWAFLADLRGTCREGRVSNLLRMLDVMTASSYQEVRDMATRISVAAAEAQA